MVHDAYRGRPGRPAVRIDVLADQPTVVDPFSVPGWPGGMGPICSPAPTCSNSSAGSTVITHLSGPIVRVPGNVFPLVSRIYPRLRRRLGAVPGGPIDLDRRPDNALSGAWPVLAAATQPGRRQGDQRAGADRNRGRAPRAPGGAARGSGRSPRCASAAPGRPASNRPPSTECNRTPLTSAPPGGGATARSSPITGRQPPSTPSYRPTRARTVRRTRRPRPSSPEPPRHVAPAGARPTRRHPPVRGGRRDLRRERGPPAGQLGPQPLQRPGHVADQSTPAHRPPHPTADPRRAVGCRHPETPEGNLRWCRKLRRRPRHRRR